MQTTLTTEFANVMEGLSPTADSYVPQIVDLLLQQARRHRASDMHLVPSEHGLQVQWRIDGVLQPVAVFAPELSPRIIARLKVLCGLLTYRTDVPQEGRVSREHSATEIRVATFPTLYGEKAAVRLFAEDDRLQYLSQLGLPQDVLGAMHRQLEASDGVILLTGPSGSGKTTTAYACLRQIVADPQAARSVMTLEDPIEVAVTGVTQSQVRPSVGFDLAAGLRSLMRQDPDVIMVGEIRDPLTAIQVFQAALTGHLVLTTFHAGSCIEAITRLLDMGIEPYLLRSALRSVVCQRLLRKLQPEDALDDRKKKNAKLPDKSAGEDDLLIAGDGVAYCGRMVLVEMLNPGTPHLARGILRRQDARQLAEVARQSGFHTLRMAAEAAVADGLTSQTEVFRVLGPPLEVE